jgi:HAMP domain-containing protein
MGERKYKRRVYIVDPDFQYGLIRKLSMIAVLVIAMSFAFLGTVHQLYGDLEIEVTQPDPFAGSESVTALPEKISLFKLLWPVMLVCVMVTLGLAFFFGVIISHRMAGPIYRMRRTLEKIYQGDLRGEIRLRKKDDFKSLAENINNLSKSWTTQIKELKELGRKFESGDADMQKETIHRFNAILSTYKTE